MYPQPKFSDRYPTASLEQNIAIANTFSYESGARPGRFLIFKLLITVQMFTKCFHLVQDYREKREYA